MHPACYQTFLMLLIRANVSVDAGKCSLEVMHNAVIIT